MADTPVLPDYRGGCISNVVPAILTRGQVPLPGWMPPVVTDARQVVLLVLDGLGWEQMCERPALAPTLVGMQGSAITTVVPSTTATALTSISTGVPPGEHGVVGYRIDVHGSVLNVLRWTTPQGDARRSIPPRDLQPLAPFLSQRPPVITKAEFLETGFTGAHLTGGRFVPWRQPSTLVVEIARKLAEGEPFVYAYYDGIDKVAHEYGLAEHYDAELAFVDRMVADILEVLPAGAVLVITADHGQVDCDDRVIPPHRDVLAHVRLQSGEGRFRWLHAHRGREAQLLEAARAHHADLAWVLPREEILAQGWFGPHVTPRAAGRLGDVALVARAPVAFDDPTDSGPFVLVARHGSLTAAEMLVPLLAGGRA